MATIDLTQLDDETIMLVSGQVLRNLRAAQLHMFQMRKLARPMLDELERRGLNAKVAESRGP